MAKKIDKEEISTCSFCNKQEDDVYLYNDAKTICICQSCSKLFANFIRKHAKTQNVADHISEADKGKISNFNVPSLSQKIVNGIKIGDLPGGTGLDVNRYIRTDSDGNLSSCVVYIEEWDNEKTACRVRGACYGYAGSGEYEGCFFLIDFNADEHRVLDFSEADEDENSQLFDALMFECGRIYDEDDGVYELSNYAEDLIKKGEDTDDGVVFMDDDFDGDSLDRVSEMWVISLRFES